MTARSRRRQARTARSHLNTSGQGFLIGASVTAVPILLLETVDHCKTHKKPILSKKDVEDAVMLSLMVGSLVGGGSLYGHHRIARR